MAHIATQISPWQSYIPPTEELHTVSSNVLHVPWPWCFSKMLVKALVNHLTLVYSITCVSARPVPCGWYQVVLLIQDVDCPVGLQMKYSPCGFRAEPTKTVLKAAAWHYGILKVLYFQTLSTKFAWLSSGALCLSCNVAFLLSHAKPKFFL